MALGTLYIVSAPSGCGKTSLIASLIKALPQLAVSVSYTTRPARSREVSGVHYWFVTIEYFQQMIRENAFLEYAKVFDHYYGTSRIWVDQQLQQGMDIILEIDWQGMRQIKKYYPEAVSIFILPPSFDSLRKRLIQRDQDLRNIIENRLKKARVEIEHFKEYDYLVTNNDNEFQKAVTDLKAIVQSYRLRSVAQLSTVRALLKESF